jgi:3'-phosphoadenosine 5'-phosphosulfate sulfotransferase (PAPS reductase)/FAD synthetase
MADFGFTSEDVIREARARSPQVLMSFSTGKDSIAAYLAIRDAGFEDIQPFYMYQVPGNLEFIEESLAYYERHLFDGRGIIRYPHPCIARVLATAMFQPPDRLPLLDDIDMERFTDVEVEGWIKQSLNYPLDALTATGVRAADSQNRYSAFKRYGMNAALNLNRGKFTPVFDWNKDRVIEAIVKAGALGLRFTPESP